MSVINGLQSVQRVGVRPTYPTTTTAIVNPSAVNTGRPSFARSHLALSMQNTMYLSMMMMMMMMDTARTSAVSLFQQGTPPAS